MPFLVDSGRECWCLVEEVPQARVERATRGLGNRCSSILSYWGTHHVREARRRFLEADGGATRAGFASAPGAGGSNPTGMMEGSST